MIKLGKCIAEILLFVQFQAVALSENQPQSLKENSSLDYTADNDIRAYQSTNSNSIYKIQTKEETGDNKHSLRSIRSNPFNETLLVEQFGQFCSSVGSQPCTCYYPDHKSVPQFELSPDKFTQKASGVNGTGPENCQDLRNVGYSLTGFYMVRFKPKRIKAIYCEFSNQIVSKAKHEVTIVNENSKNWSNNSFRFCGGVKGKQCTYLYSDNPDAPQIKNVPSSSIMKEPKNCKDLKLIGHYLNGFYFVWLNSIKVKIVYCIFSNKDTDEKLIRHSQSTSTSKNTEESPYCHGLGSQPCSCYYSNSPNILQFELGTDEITKKALIEYGPSSCKDLESIGYTFKGFYLVRFSDKIIKTVFCEFDQTTVNRDDANVALKFTTMKNKQDLIPFLNPLLMNTNHSNRFAYITRKQPDQQMTSTTKYIEISTQDTTIEPKIKTQSTIKQTVSFIETLDMIPLNQKDGKSYLLMNKHNKCMSSRSLNKFEIGVVQSNCNSNDKGQLWKWSGNRLRNSNGQFVSKVQKGTSFEPATRKQTPIFKVHLQSLITSQWIHQTWDSTAMGQLVSNDGSCLGVENNSDSHDAVLSVDSCNKNEKGQFWFFVSSNWAPMSTLRSTQQSSLSKILPSNFGDAKTYLVMNKHNK